MAMLNGLKTTYLLIKKNIIVPNNCILCNSGSESHRHLFLNVTFPFRLFLSLCLILISLCLDLI
ncbi:hypothetical protein MA16_Dca024119 [Dendrobium catenatum]|uniref:Uncharacterized protein n=1 Tax=Dendrobium catenatum TaxID=906689 RepID=A0A2I0WVT1_9ASPA|nr:hypothetical protein MA16_Dca024119 [Dendrobium catenatum]